MTDEIERAFAEATKKLGSIDHYECRNCGETFESGRDARQHMFSEHDNPKGVETIRS